MIREILLDLLHIGVETDGKHAVSFVKDEDTDAGKIKRMAQNMVQNTSRRADDELSAPSEPVELFFVAHAAVQRDAGDAGSFKKAGGFVFHLQGELPGGHEDEGFGPGLGAGENRKHRKKITSCFAGSRAGLDHDVSAVHEIGQGEGLYRHKPGPAHSGARILHGLRQVGKIHGRQGIFRLRDGNIVLKSERAGVCGRSVLYILFCHDECKKKEGIIVPARGNIEKR